MQNTYKCSTIAPVSIFVLIEENLQNISSLYRIKDILISCCNLPVFSLVFAVSLGSVSLTTYARNIDHVNVGRIEVDNQSLRSQQEAGRLALAQVFIKLSGNQRVLLEPEISKAVDNYEQFLISSSFLQQSESLVFEATFNQAKIENLLHASGLSVWASLRPSAVLWLAINNVNQQKIMVSQFSAPNLAQKLRLKSFARGVDIVLPLGDLEDSMKLSVYDIWNQYISKIQEQSNRYSTDYLISATVQSYNQDQATIDLAESEIFYNRYSTNADDRSTQIDEENNPIPITADNVVEEFVDPDSPITLDTNELIEVQQYLMVDNLVPDGTTHKLDYVITHVDPNISKKVETGRIFGESEESVMLKVVDVYANMLAKEFALSTPSIRDKQTIQLEFAGIDSLQDYVNLMALIRSLPAVENVRLIKQSGTNSVLEIQQNMSIIQLKSILTLDERISAAPVTADAAISFRWLG